MDVKILDQNKKAGKLSFMIKGVTPAFANALRRSIIDEVPTMAIEDVEFRKNNSILYDEMLAHRLGLVPLKTDLSLYNLPNDCTCRGVGCAKCSVKLTLSVKTPGDVLSSELKSDDPKIVPVIDNIPLVKLMKGQEVDLTGTAMLGKGKNHIKWTPGLVWYTYKPSITVNNNSKKLAEMKDKYPPQIFDKSGKIDKSKLVDPFLIDACDGVCDDVVKVDYENSAFIFYVESWGQLAPKDMVAVAADEFNKKTDEFTDLLK